MKTCGIVAEYNPFHNGHIHQIQETKKQKDIDVFIAVMSGNFVQRGEPALLHKRRRAQIAVENGIDVVIELPYIYATQSANQFAQGAISLLKLASVDYISFGSECGNLENLKEIADTPINPDHLHVSLAKGMSFPKAYSLLTSDMLPNDILAVSYLKEIKDTNIEPILIQRTSNYLDDSFSENASALAIRSALKDKKDVSSATPAQLDIDAEYAYFEMYYPYLRTLLLTTPKQRLQEMFLVSEGLETHLINNAKEYDNALDFLNGCTNYRYTTSRIRRTCFHIMTQTTKKEVERLPKLETIRVLAFNDTGKKWLHNQRDKIQIASTFSSIPSPWRALEYRSTLLYSSIFSKDIRNDILQEELKGAQYIKK